MGTTILSIGFQTPLIEIFGSNGCHIFWFSNIVQYFLVAIGGFSMGLFRLICVFNNHFAMNVRSAWRLMKLIMTLQFITTIVYLLYGIVGVSYAGNH